MTLLGFCRMFADGFRAMWRERSPRAIGRVLWVLVLAKLLLLLCVIKPLFFKNELAKHASSSEEKGAFVANSLINRSPK